jgi:hypothetical protein
MQVAGADLWINTVRYSVPELVVFGLGCVLWLVAYVAILYRGWKYHFIEIPAAAVVANVSWEFMWSFVYTGDTGRLMEAGYRGWVFLDFVIVFGLFKYGESQVVTPALRRYVKPAIGLGIASWMAFIYYFVREGYDMSMGATSAYIINVMMSAVYIAMLWTHPERQFSALIGWTKGVGTACFSLFMVMAPMHRYPDDALVAKGFLLSLCLVTLVLDVIYIVALHNRPLRRSAA